MWAAYSRLAPGVPLPSTYADYVQDAPYPATVPARAASGESGGHVTLGDIFTVMREYYQGMPYDLTVGMAAGPFGSPARWAAGAGEGAVHGAWERPIAIVRTIVSYVVQCRAWLPRAVGATLWLAPHAAHTSVYVPLPAGMAEVPAAYTVRRALVVRTCLPGRQT